MNIPASEDPVEEVEKKEEVENKEEVEKKRKRRKKFDENSLVRPSGLTTLKQRISTRVKVLGRGHEARYVRQLMREYNGWGHDVVPWLAFEDAVNRCQKLRGKKAVQEIIQSMRDDEAEAYVERKYGASSYKRRHAQHADDIVVDDEPDSPDEDEEENKVEAVAGAVGVVPSAAKPESTGEDVKAMIARKREEALERKRAREVMKKEIITAPATTQSEMDEEEFFEDEDEFFDEDGGAGPTEAELEAMMEIEMAAVDDPRAAENKVTQEAPGDSEQDTEPQRASVIETPTETEALPAAAVEEEEEEG